MWLTVSLIYKCVNKLNSIFNYCWRLKSDGTHIVYENGGLLGGLEEWSVAGVLEVASVLLKGGFVQSLQTNNTTFIKKIQKLYLTDKDAYNAYKDTANHKQVPYK